MRYGKVCEDGSVKKVTESYVIDAASFGDAEEQAMEYMSAYVSGDIQIVNINPMKLKRLYSVFKNLATDTIRLSCSISHSMKNRAAKRRLRFNIL